VEGETQRFFPRYRTHTDGRRARVGRSSAGAATLPRRLAGRREAPRGGVPNRRRRRGGRCLTPAVSLEHKLAVLNSLQRRGRPATTAGNGVKGAPALEPADIGVAMGAARAEVAEATAGTMLLDDDRATAVAAPPPGRTAGRRLGAGRGPADAAPARARCRPAVLAVAVEKGPAIYGNVRRPCAA